MDKINALIEHTNNNMLSQMEEISNYLTDDHIFNFDFPLENPSTVINYNKTAVDDFQMENSIDNDDNSTLIDDNSNDDDINNINNIINNNNNNKIHIDNFTDDFDTLSDDDFDTNNNNNLDVDNG